MKISERESLNVWGKAALFAGVAIIIAFAYLINGQFIANTYVNWNLINAILLWLIFVILVITVNKEHIEDIRVMRQITQEQLEELKILRKHMTKKK